MTQGKVTISTEDSRAGGNSVLHCAIPQVMCRQRYNHAKFDTKQNNHIALTWMLKAITADYSNLLICLY